MTAVAYGLLSVLAEEGSPGPAVSIFSGITSTAAIAGAPLAAWLLHGRRLGWTAGLVFQALVAFSMLLGLALSPITDAEFAGPIGLLVLVSVAFALIVVALAVLAIRDLGHNRRMHVGLDVVRLCSLAILAVYAIGALVVALTSEDPERGEAMIFVIAAGLSAAVMVFTADVVVDWFQRRKAT